MANRIEFLDPEVRPPEYRVPRGRSGVGAETALETLLNDLERIRRAKEAYGEPAERAESWQFRF
jgi:hypothetical protein